MPAGASIFGEGTGEGSDELEPPQPRVERVVPPGTLEGNAKALRNLPHASTDLVDEVVGALGRSKKGVDFNALDNQPVHLVMLFLVPQGQFQKHLHTLANIAKMLHKSDFRQALEQAPDADTMLAAIRDQGKK